MVGRGAESAQGGPVLVGAVALVPLEPVAAVAAGRPGHDLVPGHLGDDAGRGHAGGHLVALLDPEDRGRHAGQGEAVGQGVVVAALQLAQRPGQQGDVGPLEPDPVDRVGPDADHGHGQGVLVDLGGQAAAALGGEQLGVGQPLDGAVPGQDHGGGDQRPGEGAAARLVDPGDPAEAGVAQPVLEQGGGGGEHRQESNGGWRQRSRRSQPMWLSGQMRTNARPTTSARWIAPKMRESWELARLSPITNSSPGRPWSSCSPRSWCPGRGRAPPPSGRCGPGWPSWQVMVSPGRPTTRLMKSRSEGGTTPMAWPRLEKKPATGLLGPDRLEARLLVDEHDHVAVLDVAEAVGDLLDQHPVGDVEGRLHRPRGDVEGRDQEGLEDHGQQHGQGDQHHRLADDGQQPRLLLVLLVVRRRLGLGGGVGRGRRRVDPVAELSALVAGLAQEGWPPRLTSGRGCASP